MGVDGIREVDDTGFDAFTAVALKTDRLDAFEEVVPFGTVAGPCCTEGGRVPEEFVAGSKAEALVVTGGDVALLDTVAGPTAGGEGEAAFELAVELLVGSTAGGEGEVAFELAVELLTGSTARGEGEEAFELATGLLAGPLPVDVSLALTDAIGA